MDKYQQNIQRNKDLTHKKKKKKISKRISRTKHFPRNKINKINKINKQIIGGASGSTGEATETESIETVKERLDDGGETTWELVKFKNVNEYCNLYIQWNENLKKNHEMGTNQHIKEYPIPPYEYPYMWWDRNTQKTLVGVPFVKKAEKFNDEELFDIETLQGWGDNLPPYQTSGSDSITLATLSQNMADIKTFIISGEKFLKTVTNMFTKKYRMNLFTIPIIRKKNNTFRRWIKSCDDIHLIKSLSLSSREYEKQLFFELRDILGIQPDEEKLGMNGEEKILNQIIESMVTAADILKFEYEYYMERSLEIVKCAEMDDTKFMEYLTERYNVTDEIFGRTLETNNRFKMFQLAKEKGLRYDKTPVGCLDHVCKKQFEYGLEKLRYASLVKDPRKLYVLSENEDFKEKFKRMKDVIDGFEIFDDDEIFEIAIESFRDDLEKCYHIPLLKSSEGVIISKKKWFLDYGGRFLTGDTSFYDKEPSLKDRAFQTFQKSIIREYKKKLMEQSYDIGLSMDRERVEGEFKYKDKYSDEELMMTRRRPMWAEDYTRGFTPQCLGFRPFLVPPIPPTMQRTHEQKTLEQRRVHGIERLKTATPIIHRDIVEGEYYSKQKFNSTLKEGRLNNDEFEFWPYGEGGTFGVQQAGWLLDEHGIDVPAKRSFLMKDELAGDLLKILMEADDGHLEKIKKEGIKFLDVLTQYKIHRDQLVRDTPTNDVPRVIANNAELNRKTRVLEETRELLDNYLKKNFQIKLYLDIANEAHLKDLEIGEAIYTMFAQAAHNNDDTQKQTAIQQLRDSNCFHCRCGPKRCREKDIKLYEADFVAGLGKIRRITNGFPNSVTSKAGLPLKVKMWGSEETADRQKNYESGALSKYDRDDFLKEVTVNDGGMLGAVKMKELCDLWFKGRDGDYIEIWDGKDPWGPRHNAEEEIKELEYIKGHRELTDQLQTSNRRTVAILQRLEIVNITVGDISERFSLKKFPRIHFCDTVEKKSSPYCDIWFLKQTKMFPDWKSDNRELTLRTDSKLYWDKAPFGNEFKFYSFGFDLGEKGITEFRALRGMTHDGLDWDYITEEKIRKEAHESVKPYFREGENHYDSKKWQTDDKCCEGRINAFRNGVREICLRWAMTDLGNYKREVEKCSELTKKIEELKDLREKTVEKLRIMIFWLEADLDAGKDIWLAEQEQRGFIAANNGHEPANPVNGDYNPLAQAVTDAKQAVQDQWDDDNTVNLDALRGNLIAAVAAFADIKEQRQVYEKWEKDKEQARLDHRYNEALGRHDVWKAAYRAALAAEPIDVAVIQQLQRQYFYGAPRVGVAGDTLDVIKFVNLTDDYEKAYYADQPDPVALLGIKNDILVMDDELKKIFYNNIEKMIHIKDDIKASLKEIDKRCLTKRRDDNGDILEAAWASELCFYWNGKGNKNPDCKASWCDAAWDKLDQRHFLWGGKATDHRKAYLNLCVDRKLSEYQLETAKFFCKKDNDLPKSFNQNNHYPSVHCENLRVGRKKSLEQCVESVLPNAPGGKSYGSDFHRKMESCVAYMKFEKEEQEGSDIMCDLTGVQRPANSDPKQEYNLFLASIMNAEKDGIYDVNYKEHRKKAEDPDNPDSIHQPYSPFPETIFYKAILGMVQEANHLVNLMVQSFNASHMGDTAITTDNIDHMNAYTNGLPKYFDAFRMKINQIPEMGAVDGSGKPALSVIDGRDGVMRRVPTREMLTDPGFYNAAQVIGIKKPENDYGLDVGGGPSKMICQESIASQNNLLRLNESRIIVEENKGGGINADTCISTVGGSLNPTPRGAIASKEILSIQGVDRSYSVDGYDDEKQLDLFIDPPSSAFSPDVPGFISGEWMNAVLKGQAHGNALAEAAEAAARDDLTKMFGVKQYPYKILKSYLIDDKSGMMKRPSNLKEIKDLAAVPETLKEANSSNLFLSSEYYGNRCCYNRSNFSTAHIGYGIKEAAIPGQVDGDGRAVENKQQISDASNIRMSSHLLTIKHPTKLSYDAYVDGWGKLDTLHKDALKQIHDACDPEFDLNDFARDPAINANLQGIGIMDEFKDFETFYKFFNSVSQYIPPGKFNEYPNFLKNIMLSIHIAMNLIIVTQWARNDGKREILRCHNVLDETQPGWELSLENNPMLSHVWEETVRSSKVPLFGHDYIEKLKGIRLAEAVADHYLFDVESTALTGFNGCYIPPLINESSFPGLKEESDKLCLSDTDDKPIGFSHSIGKENSSCNAYFGWPVEQLCDGIADKMAELLREEGRSLFLFSKDKVTTNNSVKEEIRKRYGYKDPPHLPETTNTDFSLMF